MENNKTLQVIFEEAGRGPYCDITHKRYKQVNDILEMGIVKIEIAPLGKIYTSASKFQFNVKVSAGGKSSLFKITPGHALNVSHVAAALGNLLMVPMVKEKLQEDLKRVVGPEVEICLRCQGAGWFPQWGHIDNGVCFGCAGSGFKLVKI